MTRSAQLLAMASAMSAIALAAPTARAETTPGEAQRAGPRWVLEVDGSSCAMHKSGFEREITLACAAMATCSVTSRENAELEAVLQCRSDGSWWLETRTVEGTALASVVLPGATPEDRLREAAVDVARDVAPERTLATETLRNALDTNADQVRPKKLYTSPNLSVVVGATAAAVIGEARLTEEDTVGGRFAAGYRATARGHVMWSVAGAAGGAASRQLRRVRSGLGWAWGAPFRAVPIGVSIEAGLDATQRYHRVFRAPDSAYEAATHLNGYGQASLFVQAPFRSVRPFAAGTLAVLTNGFASFGAEVGIAIPLF